MNRILPYATALVLAIISIMPAAALAQLVPVPPPPGNPSGLPQALPPAEGAGSGITISGIFARLAQVLNLIIPLLLLAATVVFLWGVVRYVTAGDDEQKISEARQVILWGIVALAAMVAVWGLVYLLTSAIFGTTNLPGIPGVDLDPFL